MHYFSSLQVFMGDIKDIKQKCIVIKKAVVHFIRFNEVWLL